MAGISKAERERRARQSDEFYTWAKPLDRRVIQGLFTGFTYGEIAALTRVLDAVTPIVSDEWGEDVRALAHMASREFHERVERAYSTEGGEQ